MMGDASLDATRHTRDHSRVDAGARLSGRRAPADPVEAAYVDWVRFLRRRRVTRALTLIALGSGALGGMVQWLTGGVQPLWWWLHVVCTCAAAYSMHRCLRLYAVPHRRRSVQSGAALAAIAALHAHAVARLGHASIRQGLVSQVALTLHGAVLGGMCGYAAHRRQWWMLLFPTARYGVIERLLDQAPTYATHVQWWTATGTAYYAAVSLLWRPLYALPMLRFVLLLVLASASWAWSLLVVRLSSSQPESFTTVLLPDPPMQTSSPASRASVPPELWALQRACASGSSFIPEASLLAVLQQSVRHGHRDMFLHALFDWQTAACASPLRRAALFANARGAVLLPLLDLCLDIIDPDALTTLWPQRCPRPHDRSRTSTASSVAYALAAVRYAVVGMAAVARHSRAEDRYGVVQRRLTRIAQRLAQLDAALTSIFARYGRSRPATALESMLLRDLMDNVSGCRAWIAETFGESLPTLHVDSDDDDMAYRKPSPVRDALRRLLRYPTAPNSPP
ncbi:hypothetical protein CDCA_CDCA02G0772 [Cyanidium caldarium]|uniref:Uncharacterized protein n=1 Tax=Cyanidium caldarium TaxID=2771 RepID=A0AAV9IQV0_CYACA|nr:hypothetical protein CDCA_CDCA02G0772 [Cyanidium caldarium]